MTQALSLDGDWQVIFDDDNKGRPLHWEQAGSFLAHPEPETVSVPACLEEFRQDYEGVAWYGRVVSVPEDWTGKTVRIRFDAVNYRAEVWINGEAAGAHEGGYVGFDLEIGDLLRPGEDNFIAVRVITPLITRDVVIDGLGRDDMPHWRGAIAGGIWQSVSLLATDCIYLDDLFVRGRIDTGEAAVDLVLHNASEATQQVDLTWTIGSADGQEPETTLCQTLGVRPGTVPAACSLTVPNHRLWSPEEPNLYRLRVTVCLKGAVSDTRTVRFGFREFTVRGKHFHLNGRKLILKYTFNEAFYPHSLAYPRDLDLLRREFELIKEGNINLVRPWRKPQPSCVYDLADEMGVLFFGALPVECMDNWPQITPYTRTRIENEVTEMVRRDRNHPSIVVWEMFNEILRHGLKRLRHTTSLKARELDETRLILAESGGFAGVCSLYLPGAFEPTLINDVHDYPGMPLDQEGYDNLLFLGKSAEQMEALGQSPRRNHRRSHIEPGLLTNVSELGYGSIPDLEDNMEHYLREGNPLTPDYRIHRRLLDSYRQVFADTDLASVFPTLKDFTDACQHIHYVGNKLMAEACRTNPDIAGIGIHSLNDGDWIVGAGLIDNFRQPKAAFHAIKEVFADRYIALRPGTYALYAGENLDLGIKGVNDADPLSGRLTVTLQTPGGDRELFNQLIELPHGVADLEDLRIPIGDWEGPCSASLEFQGNQGLSLHNHIDFHVLDREPSTLAGHAVLVVDCDQTLTRYLQSAGPAVHDFPGESDTQAPVLINLNGWDGRTLPHLDRLTAWVEAGGTAVVLDAPPLDCLQNIGRGRMWHELEAGRALPFATTYFEAKGLWMPCSHVVRDHPVYDGLPVNCLMGQVYRNVVARRSLALPETNWIAGTVTYDWYAGLKHKQNYLGVSGAHHGADLAHLPHGSGRFVLSTHRLTANLGQDPVADRILANLVRWLGRDTRQSPHSPARRIRDGRT